MIYFYRSMIKIISPFLYLALAIPVAALSLMTLILLDGHGIRSFLPGAGEIEGLIGIILFGGLFFWFGSRVLCWLEKIVQPSFYDHIRQSIGYYLLILFVLVYVVITPNSLSGGLDFGYILAFIPTSLWAIVVNYFFILQLRKKTSGK